jgi:N utilization substance protein B
VSELGAARHRSRERAFELLYEQAIKQRPAREVLGDLEAPVDDYTVALVRASEDHQSWAHELLRRHAQDWPLERMALVDRVIMTLALCELRLDDAPPRAVVLDEAVEFAKVYSTDASPSFVNGVLSACVNDAGAFGDR